MSFNFSLNFGHLVQTNVYSQNAEDNLTSEPVAATTSNNLQVTLYPVWYKHVTVEWSVPADWGNCLFNVYFSPSITGPFERLNNALIDGNHFEDTNTQDYSKIRKSYYIVEAVLLDDNNACIKSKPESWDTYQNQWVQLRSREVQRREYLLLRKFVGVKTSIFKKKTYGERCPECWNKRVGKSLKDNCVTCLGTTFKGGYFPAHTTYLQYDPANNSNIKSYFGVFEPGQSPAWTISMPEIAPDDILIRHGEWDLYKVNAVARTELQGKAVRQLLQLNELSKYNVEYKLLTRDISEFPQEYA